MPCLSPSGLEQVLACFVCQHRHGQSGEEISWNPKGARSLSEPSIALNRKRKHISRRQPRFGRDCIETHSRDMLFLTLPFSSSKATDTEVWVTVVLRLWYPKSDVNNDHHLSMEGFTAPSAEELHHLTAFLDVNTHSAPWTRKTTSHGQRKMHS